MAKNKHHLICTSRGGSSHPDNVKPLNEDDHAAIHKVFRNMLPHEMIACIANAYKGVIRAEFRELLAEIVDIDPREMYQPQAFRNEKQFQRLKNEVHTEVIRLISEVHRDGEV